MDRRYFHGIRTTAAKGLIRHAHPNVDWIGLHHLEKAFRELFCLPGTSMTRPNDFSNRASYNVQCTIPRAIGSIRDGNKKSPSMARRFLRDKLVDNDNSNNEVSTSAQCFKTWLTVIVLRLLLHFCAAQLPRRRHVVEW